MNCSDFADSFELYAVGALEAGDSEALREHLDTGCPHCAESMRLALQNTAILSASVPLVEPPAHLRRKVLAAFLPQEQKKRAWSFLPWLVTAAALIAMIAGGEYERRVRTADFQEAQRMSKAIEIVQAPGTKQVAFAQGSLFIHQKLGVALTANLPAAPDGWQYESWVVPKQGAPQPVESFPAVTGSPAVTVVPGPVKVSDWSAVAISMEPLNSKPTKPTKLVFNAPV
jgi:hypothetical protein